MARLKHHRRGKAAATAAIALIGIGLLASCGTAATAPHEHAAHHAAEALAGTANPHPVAGKFRPDATTVAECSARQFDQHCYEQAFGNLAYRAGPKVALRQFAAAMGRDPNVERGCHRMAHAIGSAALARYKGDVARAFAEGGSNCWSGYYHGILERALLDVHGEDALVAVARKLCSAPSVRIRPFLAYQCIHGLGHGLMIHTGLNLPASLKVCERLVTSWDQTSCDGGVFMENFNTSYGVRSPYLRDNDLLYPCDSVARRHKLYCYLQVTDRILDASGGDWDRASRLCGRAERDWRATCFQSYGRSVSSAARGDARAASRLCAALPQQWRADCAYGVARDLTSNDEGGVRASAFCRALPERARPRCFYGVGTILAGIYVQPGRLARECAQLAGRYEANCTLQRSAA